MVLAYQVFYITILNYFLATGNCNWLSKDLTLRFLNVDFPTEGEQVMAAAASFGFRA
jgi:hypothetical protein